MSAHATARPRASSSRATRQQAANGTTDAGDVLDREPRLARYVDITRLVLEHVVPLLTTAKIPFTDATVLAIVAQLTPPPRGAADATRRP